MKLKSNDQYSFGIQALLSAKQTLILDDKNKDHLWEEVMMKEIRKIESSNSFMWDVRY